MPSEVGGDHHQDIDEHRWFVWLDDQARRHARLFFGLANGILQDPAEAEDACQIALMKAWEERQSFREPAAIRGWITRVVITESLAIVRRRRVARRWAVRVATNGSQADDEGAKTPATSAEEADLRDALYRAIEQLPEVQRAIVAMRELFGVSGRAMADLLGCSEGEVSRQLQIGRQRLRELMADDPEVAGTTHNGCPDEENGRN